jgi:hypothetical protein
MPTDALALRNRELVSHTTLIILEEGRRYIAGTNRRRVRQSEGFHMALNPSLGRRAAQSEGSGAATFETAASVRTFDPSAAPVPLTAELAASPSHHTELNPDGLRAGFSVRVN